MKIKNIELFPIRMKPVKPDWQANQPSHVHGHVAVIVRIVTDSGIVGLGEAATSPAYFNQTLGSVLDWLRGYSGALAGEDALDIVNAHRIMNGISGTYAPGCHPARAGIDLALYDICGKAHQCPVYEVLGGAYRTEFEMLTNLYELTPEDKAAASKEYVAKGFRGLKVKIGTSTIRHGVNVDTLRYEKELLPH